MKISNRTILITLTAAVIAIGFSFGAWYVFRQELIHTTSSSIEKSEELFTKAAADSIEQYFYDIQKRVETVANTPAVREAQRGEPCNQELQKFVEINKQEFNNIGRIDKNGVFICAVNRTIIGEPSSKYGNYFKTIAEDPQHKPVMSRLITPSGSASSVIAVHVPVFDSKGEFNGTIGGAVYFEELQNRVLHSVNPSKNSVIALYDDNLDILYHPNALVHSKNLLDTDVIRLFSPEQTIRDFAKAIKTPPAHGTITYSLNGVDRLTVYRSIPVIGRYWTVGVAVPVADIQDAAKDQRMERILILTLVLLIIAAIVSSFTIAHYRQPSLRKSKKE